jgi:hypothetical protein
VDTLEGDLDSLKFDNNTSISFSIKEEKKTVINSSFQNINIEDMLKDQPLKNKPSNEDKIVEKKKLLIVNQEKVFELLRALREAEDPESIMKTFPVEVVQESVRKYIHLIGYGPPYILNNKELMVESIINCPDYYERLPKDMRTDKDFILKLFRNWKPTDRCESFFSFVQSMEPYYDPGLEDDDSILIELAKHSLIPKTQNRMFSNKKVVMEILKNPSQGDFFNLIDSNLQNDRDLILLLLKSKSSIVPKIPLELQVDEEIMNALFSKYPDLIEDYNNFMDV